MGSGRPQQQACAECTKLCLKIHGKITHSQHADPLSFFKIMIGPFKSTLFIPPKVACRLESLLDQEAYLLDSKGSTWIVKVSIVKESLAFQQGWDQFISAHRIEHGELVVFKYIAKSKFSVQIFGTSGCERLHFSGENKGSNKRNRHDILSSCDHPDLHKVSETFGVSKEKCLFAYVSSDDRKKATTNRISGISSSELTDSRVVAEGLNENANMPRISSCQSDQFQISQNVSATTYTKGLCPEIVEDPVDGKAGNGDTPNAYTNLDMYRGIGNHPDYYYYNSFMLPQTTKTGNGRHGNENLLASKGSTNHSTGKQVSILDSSEVPFCKVGELLGKGQQTITSPHIGSYISRNNKTNSVDVKQIQTESGTSRNYPPIEKEAPVIDCPDEPGNHLAKKQKTRMELIPSVDPTASEISGDKYAAESSGELTLAVEKLFIIDENSQGCHNASIEECKKSDNHNLALSTTHALSLEGSASKYTQGSNNMGNMNKHDGTRTHLIDFSHTEIAEVGHISEEEEKVAATKQESFHWQKIGPAREDTKDEVPDPVVLDEGSCKLLLTGGGPCLTVEEFSVAEPGVSVITPVNSDGCEMVASGFKADNIPPTQSESSFGHHEKSRDPCAGPKSECPGDRDSNLLCDAIRKDHCTEERGLRSMGNEHQSMSTMKDAPCGENLPRSTTNMPKYHGNPDTTGGNSHHFVSGGNEQKAKPYLKENTPVVVKAESIDSIMLSSPTPDKFSFSVTGNARPWHDLPAPLPTKRKRHERKVVFFRDSSLMIWPVLYHESRNNFRFLGGWLAFVSAHDLQEGDVCALELVDESESIFKVQISRK